MSFETLLAQADASIQDLLGRSVTYTPTVGSAVVVKGVFDARYERADLGEAGISTKVPAVTLVLSDLPSDPETDLTATVTIAGVTYSIREAQKDGQGVVTLLLNRT